MALFTVVEAVCAPFDQAYETPPVAVSVVVLPKQIVEPVELIAAFGNAKTLTTTGALVAKQPLAFVAVTV